MKKKKSKRVLLYIFTGCLLSITGMAGTQAYLVKGSDTLVNRILPGNVAVVLTEPDWNPEHAMNMNPGTWVQKNPTVKNTGTLDAWVFVQVTVPKKNITCVDPVTGRKSDKRNQEVFSFAPGEAWELMEKKNLDTEARYIYGYKKLVQPGKSSSSLFDEIQIADYLEGELDPDEILELPVKTTAIQWNVTEKEQGLREAYAYAFGGDTV